MRTDKYIHCEIISPEGKRVFRKLTSIILPGVSGELEVLPGHAESFISLRKGQVRIKALTGGPAKEVSVKESICYIKDDYIRIIS